MPVYVNKNGQQSGPYEDHIVIDQLRNGSLSPNDMAIRQGDAEWTRLGDMFPDAVRREAPPAVGATSAASAGTVASAAAPAPKKGGCLKGGLIGLGLILLLLGIATAAGSRFIPSNGCERAESDARRIDKLRSDIEKAKSDFDYDEIGPLQLQLNEALAGAARSQKYCNDDKFRNNVVAGVGGVTAALGLLMAFVGLLVGRRK